MASLAGRLQLPYDIGWVVGCIITIISHIVCALIDARPRCREAFFRGVQHFLAVEKVAFKGALSRRTSGWAARHNMTRKFSMQHSIAAFRAVQGVEHAGVGEVVHHDGNEVFSVTTVARVPAAHPQAKNNVLADERGNHFLLLEGSLVQGTVTANLAAVAVTCLAQQMVAGQPE